MRYGFVSTSVFFIFIFFYIFQNIIFIIYSFATICILNIRLSHSPFSSWNFWEDISFVNT